MRKIGYILSTVLYLILTIGISLNSHYCGGRLLDTYLYATPECPFCDFKEMDMDRTKNDDCCDDETEFYAVDDSQQLISTVSLDSRIDILLYDAGLLSYEGFEETEATGYFFDRSSPPPEDDLTVLYSKYIFYG